MDDLVRPPGDRHDEHRPAIEDGPLMPRDPGGANVPAAPSSIRVTTAFMHDPVKVSPRSGSPATRPR